MMIRAIITLKSPPLGTVDSMIEWRWFDVEATTYGRELSPKAGRISVPQGPDR
jgi:hypothetical protein